MIFGHKMAALGYEVVAMDNLGYGMTEVNQQDITYAHWLASFSAFVETETKLDYKKTILYGLSAGGMLVYNAACFIREVHGIIGMCFLDNSIYQVGCIFNGSNQSAVDELSAMIDMAKKENI